MIRYFIYFAAAYAAVGVFFSRGATLETLGALIVVAAALAADRFLDQRQAAIDTERGTLARQVEALETRAVALEAKTAAVEALQAKVTQITNRLGALK